MTQDNKHPLKKEYFRNNGKLSVKGKKVSQTKCGKKRKQR